MIRRLLVSLLLGMLALTVAFAADDPPANSDEPPRLKKKNRPAPDAKEPPVEKKIEPPSKPGEKPKIDDEPPAPSEPEMDEQEILNRVSRNMRAAEERLANKELGDGTRQLQRDILEDLDKLINKLNQQNSDSSNQDNQSGASSNEQKQGQQKQGQQQSAQRSGGRRSGQKQSAQGQKQGGGQQPSGPGQSKQGNQSAAGKPGSGNNPGAGNGASGRENKLIDDGKDIWGHLPEKLRAEMNAYSRQDYMSKYSEVIKQYYSTVAEKGRRKGD